MLIVVLLAPIAGTVVGLQIHLAGVQRLIDASTLTSATWKQRLDAISANINELSEAEAQTYPDQGTRRPLSGHDPATRGGSARQVAYLARRLSAAGRRGRRSGAGAADRLVHLARQPRRKTIALLCSPSIARSVGPGAAGKAHLVGAATQHDQMTPEQLLHVMQDEFERARDALSRIEFAEEQGAAELDGLRHDFAGMAERAARLKADSDRPSFIELQDLQFDPLNAQAGMDSLKRGLQAWPPAWTSWNASGSARSKQWPAQKRIWNSCAACAPT